MKFACFSDIRAPTDRESLQAGRFDQSGRIVAGWIAEHGAGIGQLAGAGHRCVSAAVPLMRWREALTVSPGREAQPGRDEELLHAKATEDQSTCRYPTSKSAALSVHANRPLSIERSAPARRCVPRSHRHSNRHSSPSAPPSVPGMPAKNSAHRQDHGFAAKRATFGLKRHPLPRKPDVIAFDTRRRSRTLWVKDHCSPIAPITNQQIGTQADDQQRLRRREARAGMRPDRPDLPVGKLGPRHPAGTPGDVARHRLVDPQRAPECRGSKTRQRWSIAHVHHTCSSARACRAPHRWIPPPS
jgi:hypothetical protein